MHKLLLQSLLIIAVFISGCSSKHGHDETTKYEDDEWPPMDSFHFIMAETFHPYKDSSNLQPIKERAEELKMAVINWAEAPLPKRVNNDEVKESLLKLKTDASTLNELVKTGNDEEISASLSHLHDLFHKLQEAWYAGGEHEHEHH